MIYLLLLILGGAWSFLAALQLFRPDQLTFLTEDQVLYVNIGFGVFMLLASVLVSTGELGQAKYPWRYGAQIMLRNLGVLCAAMGLFIFIARELLHGMDPTGRHPLW